ncbi:uncharacterized protein LOC142230783 [Haematobia irritans]|uniref:uncharacterized protein LOC142230783 n=1 Tax=Haematobia irritans TaxID=7368 RepID=UPI003F4FFF72
MSLKLIKHDGRMKLNGSFSFTEDMQEANIIHWTQVHKSNGKLMNLFNISIEGCKFLDKSLGRMNPLIDAAIRNYKKYLKNLPSKCPLRKNRVIFVNKFYYDENLFPPYIPSINVTGMIGMVTNEGSAFKIFLTGHIYWKEKKNI